MGGLISRLASPWRRFRDAQSGAAAVEFAFVALPFLMLIFAIVQTALALFATQVLQSRTDAAARGIMTGTLKGSERQVFRDQLCRETFLFSCNKLGIEVRASSGFTDADPGTMRAECAAAVDPDKLDDAVEKACYTPGSGNSVMIVRVTYRWPFGIDFTSPDRSMTLAATTAFRNEPYPQ